MKVKDILTKVFSLMTVFAMTFNMTFAVDSNMITICHYPPGNPGNAQTITVNKNSLPAHLKNGATIGPCEGDEEDPVIPEEPTCEELKDCDDEECTGEGCSTNGCEEDCPEDEDLDDCTNDCGGNDPTCEELGNCEGGEQGDDCTENCENNDNNEGVPVIPPTSSVRRSSSSGSGGSIPQPFIGEVLGATDGEVLGACASFEKYHKKGDRGGEVAKIQEFLNEHMNAGLTVDGVYGNATTKAVHAFQQKYFKEIISPWVPPFMPKTTGRWYKTTRMMANEIITCSEEVVFLEDPKITYKVQWSASN